jgi:glycosyltransferase involved in cell wall biosynthesis
MRLLVVGHSFVTKYDQMKYVAIKQLDPGLKLRLVVPASMQGRFGPLGYEVHPGLSPEDVVPLKARLSGWQLHMTYLHNPVSMAAILRTFQPEVIHIEEEPQALISVETIATQRAIARGAAVTLFTWDNLIRPRRFPLGAIKHRLRSYSLRRASTVVCGNQRAAELVRAEGLFEGPTEVLPQYGLDPAEHLPGTEAQLRAELGLDGGHLVVGYLGRLVPEKGLRLLLEALGRLQSYPWRLLLVGTGPLEIEIRQRWMVDFPGRIVLVPAVPYQLVPRYLRCLDIFVLASYSIPVWKEQFGLTLAQAMMLRIPSIGSTSGAIPEVLGPGGLLFEEGQSLMLQRALEELLKSPQRREQLGAQGQEFALRNYAMESVGRRYLAAFERARSARGRVSQDASKSLKRIESNP